MADMLDRLEAIIRERRANPSDGSYTAALFAAGRPRIAQKVGEEATELIVAALSQPRDAQIDELADLVYHLLVLMADLDLTLDDLRQRLEQRHQPKR